MTVSPKNIKNDLKGPIYCAAKLGGNGAVPPQFSFSASIMSSYAIKLKIEVRTDQPYSNTPQKYYCHRRWFGPSLEQFLSIGDQNRAKIIQILETTRYLCR
jgi:hypothetical protein